MNALFPVMNIQYAPATVASAAEMCACGRRAFENDYFNNAIFPLGVQDPGKQDYLYERMKKRLEAPEWQYDLATTESAEGHAQVVGYAGWTRPRHENVSGPGDAVDLPGNHDQPQANTENAETYPKGMDVDVYKYAEEVIEKARKEILGEPEERVWCKCRSHSLTCDTLIGAELFLT
jgi:hypothetical protein